MTRKSEIIQGLLKEAASRIGLHKGAQDEFAIELLHEASTRLHKIKVGMAFQEGTGDLRRSGNTAWYPPRVSDRIRDIELELESLFSNYFKMRVKGQGNRMVAFDAGAHFPIEIPDDEKQIIVGDDEETSYFGREPDATVAMRFVYRRHIMPVNPVYRENASTAIQTVNEFLKSNNVQGTLDQFMDAIHDNDIPLHKYHHISWGSNRIGALSTKSDMDLMRRFVISEQQRHAAQPLVVPGSRRTVKGSQNYFRDTVERINAGEPITTTTYTPRRALNKKGDPHPNPTSLRLAIDIAEEVKRGRWPDWIALKEYLNKQKQADLTGQGYPQKSKKNDKTITVTRYYDEMYERLRSYMQAACYELPEGDDAKKWVDFGVDPKEKVRMRGFPLENLSGPENKPRRTKHTRVGPINNVCKVISTHELNMLLDFMKSGDGWAQPKRKGQFEDIYYTTNRNQKYQSNGLDSTPTDPNKAMPLIPSLKILADGQIHYDTDNANMGRHHLVKYGKKIEKLLTQWGPWADQVLKLMQNDRMQHGPFDDGDDEGPRRFAFDAWATVIGNGHGYGNRTNAESVLDQIVMQYRNIEWDSVVSNFMSTSLAQQTKRGQEENVRQGLGKLDRDTMISQDAFYSNYMKYGYQLSKMMDFLSALMSRSCEKVSENRINERGEKMDEFFAGHDYSPSTGKHGFGYIMVGVKYDQTAIDPVTTDTSPQATGNVIQIRDRLSTKGLTYFIAQAAPGSLEAKDLVRHPTWDRTIDELRSRYPDIWDQLGAWIQPLNADLSKIRNSFRTAISKAQNELIGKFSVLNRDPQTGERLYNQISTVVEIEEDGEIEEISAESDPEAETEVPVAPPVETPGPVPGQQVDAPIDLQETGQPQQVLPEDEAKPFPINTPSYLNDTDRITKRKTDGKSLMRKGPDPRSGKLRRPASTIELLIKAADQLDKYGYENVANKLDAFVSVITETTDV